MSEQTAPGAAAIAAGMTINDVLRRFPQTQPVMDRYHVDYCCGGHGTLAEAARAGGFDLDRFLAEMNEAASR